MDHIGTDNRTHHNRQKHTHKNTSNRIIYAQYLQPEMSRRANEDAVNKSFRRAFNNYDYRDDTLRNNQY